MSFLKNILGGKRSAQPDRVHACSQCGMPVTDHKSWCSILNGHKEGQGRLAPAAD